MTNSRTQLVVPRGKNGGKLYLEMAGVYQAEARLRDVALASPGTGPELMGYFNEVANLTTKYLAWVKHEILVAQREYDLAKATAILERAPEEFKKLDGSGIKFNEDFRNAIVTRDPECYAARQTLDSLVAVEALLDAKVKSFVRAYNAARAVMDLRGTVAATPNLSTGSLDDATPMAQDNPESWIGKART